ncbi:metallophosphoesterase [Pseudoalteromonas sp. SG43-6]|uniref:metallophosphoesterase family protein n=1 Tax=Pseudoalteromonas sp. SG43-6 TaxID=2760967 RepID=UPI0015FF4D28|nr:metallophosphoesterase [Pseudoalteromonas sp. SG43-6]MBB1433985.1 metallophosphoesterase [Pseudoalteromonas sp. SG43-6]
MKFLISLLIFLSCTPLFAAPATNTQIAFVPDIHFHDIYGDFSDAGFAGIPVDKAKDAVSIRSMQAQIHSTRLFNENYFALIATLDDIAAKGVKLVALPGDFTDDGQPVHLNGLKTILDDYAKKYGMRFFAIPGNHDPVRPFKTAGGKSDFLGSKGQQIGIYSTDHPRCEHVAKDNHSLVCSDKIAHAGYQELVEIMAPFGLQPDSRDLLWETPFGEQVSLVERSYSQCAKNNKARCKQVPDTSYLVEPVTGLWLLAIDANVYVPEFKNGTLVFQGSGNAGYNKVLTEKPYLMKWITNVVKRAKEQHKTLVAFSHFPMGEFYDGQTQSIKSLFGESAFQLAREPELNTRKLLAETGLKLHIGGHMHMNDTAIIETEHNTLFNIQAPSIAAYRPAYKLVTLNNQLAKVDTITIDDVPHFDTLFSAYQTEHDYLQKNAPAQVWDKRILTAKNYQSFSKQHLQALARWRFIPREWPADFRDKVQKMSLLEVISLLSDDSGLSKVQQQQLQTKTVLDFIADFYLVRNAGSLAFADISESTQQTYQTMRELLNSTAECKNKLARKSNNDGTLCQLKIALTQAFSIYSNLSNALPDQCLIIDMSKKTSLHDCKDN